MVAQVEGLDAAAPDPIEALVQAALAASGVYDSSGVWAGTSAKQRRQLRATKVDEAA